MPLQASVSHHFWRAMEASPVFPLLDLLSNRRPPCSIHRCEQIVTEMIQAAYPGHKIIGEEAEGSNKYELTAGPTWTIDPIDGTTNFVHRIPYTCVSRGAQTAPRCARRTGTVPRFTRREDVENLERIMRA